MFFFFFDAVGDIPEVEQAFIKMCSAKMIIDGYYDMSCYIYGTISKEEMLYRLVAEKSKYAVLFQQPYPQKDESYYVWEKYFSNEHTYRQQRLTPTETEALVYWMYMTMPDEQSRKEFTIDFFRKIKDLHTIENNIKMDDSGVVYNDKTVILKIVSSISGLNSIVSSYQKEYNMLFFRGHSDANYMLQPSLFRKDSWTRNERSMYNEILINCPTDFDNCHSHLEKLVKMQHYGLPTRLLDITTNPLVALYFACESNTNKHGEIVLISKSKDEIKYPQSDTASILASLAAFDTKTKSQFYNLAIDSKISNEDFNKAVTKLLHEIRLEKPAFKAKIKKEDLLASLIIWAIKSNPRIVKQDGAFILCGLGDSLSNLEKFRLMHNNKKVVIIIKNKQKILKQLSAFSINEATLFPEIDKVSDHIKKTYS